MNVDCQGNPATAYEHVFYVDGMHKSCIHEKILELRVALNKNTIYNVHMYTYGMANVVVGCYIFKTIHAWVLFSNIGIPEAALLLPASANSGMIV